MERTAEALDKCDRPRLDVGSREASCDGLVHIIRPIVVRMIVWTVAVRSWDTAIQYRKGTGTDTTHCRVGTQGMTCSTRWAAVWAMRRPAHDEQNPRRLQLKASSSSLQHRSTSRRGLRSTPRSCIGSEVSCCSNLASVI